MSKIILTILSLFPTFLFGQLWVDTTYSIQTDVGISYGMATDFAGVSQTLTLDISYPRGDSTPLCGRPLLVMVHGGGWFAGDKAEGYPKRIREDFAKRGYAAASVNYRLGQFHTDKFINCNVPDWNCWNMTDTSEWYRANHRGIQDVNGAIRYLINHSSIYNIDPNNVFVVGESAGGFIAMGVGFIDDDSEILDSLTSLYSDAPAPNSLYESNCIQAYGLANDISSMDLSRPDLGSYVGTLNYPANKPYEIQAVGNFYGGAFNNVFQSYTPHSPALYLYHQPCDLIVPFNYSRLLAGYTTCFMGFPANCGYIVNRPFVYGSKGIKSLIDTMTSNSIPTSEYFYDNTTNNFNCLQQATDPNLGCHAIDNYWLRTTNMAIFFAGKMDSCTAIGTYETIAAYSFFQIYPNPTTGKATIELKIHYPLVEMSIINLLGKTQERLFFKNIKSIDLDLSDYPRGVYLIKMKMDNQIFATKLMLN